VKVKKILPSKILRGVKNSYRYCGTSAKVKEALGKASFAFTVPVSPV
jgi:hypothetical protein